MTTKYRSILAEMLSDQELDVELDILELKGVRDYVVKSCLYCMQDQENLPLEQRWNIFTQIHEFLPYSRTYLDFSALGDNWSWYDHMYADRHKTVHLVDVVERIEGDDRWSHINIEQLKDEILMSGYGRFVNDW